MKSTFKKIIGFWHYGVILTYMSVVFALVGICLSVSGHHGWGIICLGFSGICDGFDGAVAKTRKNRSKEDMMFGEQIDSLSDLVAFGVAPVMIGWGMGMRKWYYIAVFAVFVLCALARLAYFNVTEELRTKDKNAGKRRYYEGLPVTNVAIFLPLVYMIATMFTVPLVRYLIMTAAYLTIAALFIARFRMPKLGVKSLIVVQICLIIILLGLLLVRTALQGGF